jgi:hypothetical protein
VVRKAQKGVSRRSIERLEKSSGTKEAVMPKKKVIPARNLQDWTKCTTQIIEKTKTIAVFLR